MDTQEKDGEKGCCGTGKSCFCKALVAVALLALGGVGGYFCGRSCALKSAAASVSSPAK